MIKIKRDRKKESITFSINKPNSKPNFSLLFTLCPSKQNNWDWYSFTLVARHLLPGDSQIGKKENYPALFWFNFSKTETGALIQLYNNTNKDTAPIFDLCFWTSSWRLKIKITWMLLKGNPRGKAPSWKGFSLLFFCLVKSGLFLPFYFYGNKILSSCHCPSPS